MDQVLLELLTRPFHVESAREQIRTREAVIDLTEAASMALKSRESEIHALFREPIGKILSPHEEMAELVLQTFYSPSLPPSLKTAVENKSDNLKEIAENLLKNFRIYIKTASEEVLLREAQRLERRFFQSVGIIAQVNFIKLKRFYEKLKTFNEMAKKDWREVHKRLDNLALTTETVDLVKKVPSAELQEISRLMRRSDAFLESLRLYMNIEREEYDSITGTFKIILTFDPSIDYTLKGFFGDPDEEAEEASEGETEEKTDFETEAGEEEFEGSIARNIVIETREHKLNNTSIFFVPIPGSRDWNRTPNYRMEITLQDYEVGLEKFKQAHMVILDSRSIQGHMTTAAAHLRKGNGVKFLSKYVVLVQESLDRIAEDIVLKDYPGLDRPMVFLYHCGPSVFLNCLFVYFQQKNVGEIFYLDENHNIVREFPIEIITREVIEWWKNKFSILSGEQIDSYMTYTRALDMVKKDYRILYDEGMELRKREQLQAGYANAEKWLRDNRNRIFGFRKVEIFKRFIPGSIFSQMTDAGVVIQ